METERGHETTYRKSIPVRALINSSHTQNKSTNLGRFHPFTGHEGP